MGRKVKPLDGAAMFIHMSINLPSGLVRALDAATVKLGLNRTQVVELAVTSLIAQLDNLEHTHAEAMHKNGEASDG
jgi:metal-responsive CopG/Arc/MetJ family transcriptional regulator